MATPTVTLITNAGPFMAPAVNKRVQKCIRIYGKLAFCGGAPYNYTSSGTNLALASVKTAVNDMRAAIGVIAIPQIDAARCFLWPRAAVTLFGAVKLTQSALTNDAGVNYLASLDDDTLDRMDLWAEYAGNAVVNGVP